MLNSQSRRNESESKENTIEKPGSPPAISLPKGGGAIRGMGEKFAANPVTGTGSMTVPIATSPGRSGFGPQLSLSYDSGAGNGPYGLGWNLALPSITRKTDKGLPKYQDAVESDVFILSGAEDLVPVLIQTAGGQWVLEDLDPRTVNNSVYRIRRYRPRIEGLFARIERWTNQADPQDTFWRSISRDNLTTWYGKTSESRIADPANPTRIFSWLICESYDDKGNVIGYQYKEENSDDVDLSQAHEHNRTPDTRKANRYLEHIRYGNHTPYFPVLTENAPWPTLPPNTAWYFEVVFDYGEHDADVPTPMEEIASWPRRNDPFSSYRAGFEIRTYRLCQRVLMFHHFPSETEVGADCLVRSTDFTYSYEENPADARNPIFSTLLSVSQSGYKRQGTGYLKKSLPPVEFQYTKPTIDGTVHEVDADSLENLPTGLDGASYQWIDLDGEGLSGILTEQAEGWFYKRNLSPINLVQQNGGSSAVAKFAPMELVATKPNTAIAAGQAQFMDLAGDGQPDLVLLDSPTPGFYEHDEGTSWNTFRPFTSQLNRDTGDPNLKFVDLDGDGHADVLITEDEAFTWHPSLAEEGFGPAQRVSKVRDEEQGPALVFADGTQSIYLADLSGDGLTDLVRIRNGEVCYWPNLGYGRFGAKVTMDNAPWFDNPDQFDQRRIHLADIDGSGVTDILYLHSDGVRLYFNQSGNSWSQPSTVPAFPRIDNLAAVTVMDLLGNGTACLVWSSPLPGNAQRPMRYVDLMGGKKPHLLVATINNLGAEARVEYASSTKFYLQDKQNGKPWITRLPFPVHVVERVETLDRISRNRFVTRSAYHQGYFDGDEREFRGFGMFEQWDTEELAALTDSGDFPDAVNIDAASHVPPVLTKTWFHTGAYLGRDHVSDFFAGLVDADDKGEYYREPGLTDAQARALLLPDTVLPDGLTAEEEREACRALKGSMLRQEIYALDSTPKSEHPYTVTEQNFTIRRVQPCDGNRNAVFFTHAREAINFHYERNPADPRIQHALTLEVDGYNNVLKEAAIGYGRRQPDMNLSTADQAKQTQTLITYTENGVTNPIDEVTVDPDGYRTPLPRETRTFELTGYAPTGAAGRFQSTDFVQATGNGLTHLFDTEIHYEDLPANGRQRRLIEQVRTLYRPDDLGEAQNNPLALLPLGIVKLLALPGESYKLAFTPGLLAQVFQRNGQPLLPSPANVLGGQGADRGGYLQSQQLKAEGKFPSTDPDDHWWIPAGRVFLSPNSNDTASQELAYARSHFFLPHRTRDPFHTNAVSTESFIIYDTYDFSMLETRDALGNTVRATSDYRVLAPKLMTDYNGNRSEVAFDVLGMVVGTAVMGKVTEILGDLLDASFETDPTQAQLDAFMAHPREASANADESVATQTVHDLLGNATTRIIYDLDRFKRLDQPPFAATLARETHVSELQPGQQTKIQISFSYSDGFGREIQKKIQAEPSPVVEGSPVVNPRWVGTGWTIFNNKGKPVRQYEPFFDDTHDFKFGVAVGVSPVLFYDPVERVIATLTPNHTYEKVVLDPWQQTSYDVNDTVTFDPKTDDNVKELFTRLPDTEYLPTWHGQRSAGQLGSKEQDAAKEAAVHADTPTVAHFDSLGRPFLTIAHNKFERNGLMHEEKYLTRVELDLEGNQRAVIDANDRIVMRYDYDLLGTRIHQASMEAGERWILGDVSGKSIRAWDSRGHAFRAECDSLRRLLRSFVTGIDPANPNEVLLTERLVYGEQHPEAELRNLRGNLYLHLDQAGVVASEVYDFKGKPLRTTRRIAMEYKQARNWSTVDAALAGNATAELDPVALEEALATRLEADTYTSRTTYDALNRPMEITTPHTPAMQPSVIRPGYNDANLLERVDVNLRGAAVAARFVINIDYDAKGQRQRIDYGNTVSTFYEYDPLTFRLTHLLTRRNAVAFPGDCPQLPPVGWPGCQLQNLHYTYDPAGNITHIRDDAQQTIYFRNNRVEPSADYIYDAIYQLIDATGREHLGQVGGPPIPHSYNDTPRVGIHWSANDGNAMGTYTEQYVYDAVGNFLEMQHRGSDPVNPGWTRTYSYNEPSLLEPSKPSNRLTSTTIGTTTETYSSSNDGYDTHGNMLHMPQLQIMQWNFRDQLHMSQRQKVNADDGDGGKHQGERTYYVYDASGQRVRKVTERQAAAGQTASRMKERIYLGGLEIYRQYESDGATIGLERETLHLTDDNQRIALVETRTQGTDGSPAELIRYQLSNHLGSPSLELDDQAKIISYEEYYPYGSTSYQAVRSVEVGQKRYRYAGKERDEETGFTYHRARYCVAWLGRWTSCDPRGVTDGPNVYAYVSGRPTQFVDPDGTEKKKSKAVESDAVIPDEVDWDAERGKHTARKAEEMKKALAAAKKANPKLTPDPMQAKAEYHRKHVSQSGRTPIEQHHHADIDQAIKVSADPDKVGQPSRMSSVWARTKYEDTLGGVGDKPLWDEGGPKEAKTHPKTHHNVAKYLDKEAQKLYPATAQGLEDAADYSKWRYPATADMTERARMDWSRTRPPGPPVDPMTGPVNSLRAKTKSIVKTAAERGTAVAKRAGKTTLAAIPLLGIGVGLSSAAYNFREGNYISGALDLVGVIPVVGDVVDIGRTVVEIAEAFVYAPGGIVAPPTPALTVFRGGYGGMLRYGGQR